MGESFVVLRVAPTELLSNRNKGPTAAYSRLFEGESSLFKGAQPRQFQVLFPGHCLVEYTRKSWARPYSSRYPFSLVGPSAILSHLSHPPKSSPHTCQHGPVPSNNSQTLLLGCSFALPNGACCRLSTATSACGPVPHPHWHPTLCLFSHPWPAAGQPPTPDPSPSHLPGPVKLCETGPLH